MEPIHEAAWHGHLAEVNRLLEEDPGRLNVQQPEGGFTPLMLSAWKGHDAVVARLLALGADMGLRSSEDGYTAVHLAVRFNRPSALALLLKAGAPTASRDNNGFTPLMSAVVPRADACVGALLTHGLDAAELDAADEDGVTAVHLAVVYHQPEILNMLLHAGANPTIPTTSGHTPLRNARLRNHTECTALLEAAIAPSLRARSLLKARALVDADYKVEKARSGGRTLAGPRRAALAAAPAYLKGRVEQGQQLPAVVLAHEEPRPNVRRRAVLEYALGLGGGEKGMGMVKEVFVELMEMLVPKWDRPHV